MLFRSKIKKTYNSTCDFSRGVLNVRLRARIQHLLRGHICYYKSFSFSDFGANSAVEDLRILQKRMGVGGKFSSL